MRTVARTLTRVIISNTFIPLTTKPHDPPSVQVPESEYYAFALFSLGTPYSN